ncbi:MAG: pyridoxine 5'-phosphate synthase [Gemmatimonadota bacterium]
MSEPDALLLTVNIDHVATLREARKGAEPDPFLAARAAEAAGAHGITLHLRQDRRHVQESDLAALKAGATTEINLELAAVPEMLDVAARYLPGLATLVPERREEITTEGGLQVRGASAVAAAVLQLRSLAMVVSLFVDPDPVEIDAAAAAGADAVELHTGRYANAAGAEASRELERLRACAAHAAAAGLRVHAGHGLDYQNVAEVARIPELAELAIGHAIVSRALFVGMQRAVGEMLQRIRSARGAAIGPSAR